MKLSLLGEPSGQQESLYGLVNAVTSAAQRLSLDERYDLEVLAGHLLESGLPATLQSTQRLDRTETQTAVPTRLA